MPLIFKASTCQCQERLEKLGLQHVQLILDGHQHVDQYVETLQSSYFLIWVICHLQDKSVITLPATTIEAMEKSVLA